MSGRLAPPPAELRAENLRLALTLEAQHDAQELEPLETAFDDAQDDAQDDDQNEAEGDGEDGVPPGPPETDAFSTVGLGGLSTGSAPSAVAGEMTASSGAAAESVEEKAALGNTLDDDDEPAPHATAAQGADMDAAAGTPRRELNLDWS